MSEKRKSNVFKHVLIVHLISIALFFVLNFTDKEPLKPITSKIEGKVDEVASSFLPEVVYENEENEAIKIENEIDYDLVKYILVTEVGLTKDEAGNLIEVIKSDKAQPVLKELSTCKSQEDIKEVLKSKESLSFINYAIKNVNRETLEKVINYALSGGFGV